LLITEAGAGYVGGRAQMNRMTPWSNDPVLDEPGEVVYLRDEEDASVWTPTPGRAAGGDDRRPSQPGLHFNRRSHGLIRKFSSSSPRPTPSSWFDCGSATSAIGPGGCP
jgi:hypothetical protein